VYRFLEFYADDFKRGYVNRLLNLIIIVSVISLILKACVSSVPATVPPVKTTNSPPGRFGVTSIEAVEASGVSGTLTAQDNGNGTTTLSIELEHAGNFNPWGIYATGDCQNGVPENTRPVFSLPDVESGKKEETVETETYRTFPGDLVVIVYGIAPDGTQQLVACGSLGPPLAASMVSTAAETPNCNSLEAGDAPEPSTDAWLAFSAAHNNNSDIYLINADAALRRTSKVAIERLTTNPAADFDPTWSPDGTQIAFRSQRDGNDEIYVMKADGTCQTNLTNDPGDDWSPAWSPNGGRIAFSHFFEGNAFTDIALINVDGSGFQRLTNGGGEYPAWAPDGTRIAFASARDGNYEIYVMNVDGTNQIRLTDNPAYDMLPTWSPDGMRIAFDTQRDTYPPVEVGIGPEFEIHIINTDGSGDVRLTNNQEEDRFPAWGPRGLIAFSRNGALFVMKPDGSDQIQLSEAGTFPAWWPVH